MSNGDYDDFLLPNDVGEIVWKNWAVSSSISTSPLSPQKWVFDDAIEYVGNIITKTSSQTSFFRFVKKRCFYEFLLRVLEELCNHDFNLRSRSEKTFPAGRVVTLPRS